MIVKTLKSSRARTLAILCLLLFPVSAMSVEVDIQHLLNTVYAKVKAITKGKNPTYIPALAAVDPKLFAISLVTVDGKIYSVGDTNVLFPIESISKPFILAAVMDHIGASGIVEKIGVNATGFPFNSIEAIEEHTDRSVNPLVNAGALAVVSLIPAANAAQRWKVIQERLNAFSGRKLHVMENIYKSESETNGRNQAIAKLLSVYGRLYANPEETVEAYTRMCSVGVTVQDVAIMGAAYANAGRNPISKKAVVKAENVPKILAVMATAGLYDTSGLWLYNVGLPAKSGVGGGIFAVMPGRFSIAAFSPPLDEAGNSVRAQQAIKEIAKNLNASIF